MLKVRSSRVVEKSKGKWGHSTNNRKKDRRIDQKKKKIQGQRKFILDAQNF
jgi:hypothetical protein